MIRRALIRQTLFSGLCAALLLITGAASAQEGQSQEGQSQEGQNHGLLGWLFPGKGDVEAGGSLDFTRPISGGLRALGGLIALDTRVRGDAELIGGRVRLGEKGRIEGNARIKAGDAIVLGEIIGNLALSGGLAEVAGAIHGNVVIDASHVVLRGVIAGDVEVNASWLRVDPGARIGGALRYRGSGRPEVSPQAEIDGGWSQVFDFEDSQPEGDREMEMGVDDSFFSLMPFWPLGIFALWRLAALPFALAAFVAQFLFGALPAWLAPGFVARVNRQLTSRAAASLFAGVAAVIVIPSLLIFLAITIIGLPITIFGFLAFGALLPWGLAVTCLALSQMVADRLWPENRHDLARLLAVFTGFLLLFTALAQTSPLGHAALMLATLFGVGALTLNLFTTTTTAADDTP